MHKIFQHKLIINTLGFKICKQNVKINILGLKLTAVGYIKCK